MGFLSDAIIEAPTDPIHSSARRLNPMWLGTERMELIEFDATRRHAVPVPANDCRFQHFAIIARDIDLALIRLAMASG